MPTSAPTMDDAAALELADRISAWLKDRIDEAGADRFVLGLSGGIDSAVVCGLCARAVGGDRVLGIIMPSASNPDDAVQARKVADAFEVKLATIDLTGVAETILAQVPSEEALYGEILGEEIPAGGEARMQLAKANIRPRSRMIVNYYMANLSRGMVVGTGNKTEYMIGYFTKYGDGGVDLAPLLDLYKFEVRAVAKAIGVPESVITRPPSAGLWEGQTDEKEIGITYADLDTALMAIETGDTSAIDPAVLDRINRMHKGSAHKRTSVPSFQK
ncbi:MAG: NAD+ synthase [Thermomicrobiales bacterium]|nr:NAD+ synthase [Thermomicrobiales bacterium]